MYIKSGNVLDRRKFLTTHHKKLEVFSKLKNSEMHCHIII